MKRPPNGLDEWGVVDALDELVQHGKQWDGRPQPYRHRRAKVEGKRIGQFVRLKWAHVSDEAVTIFDTKGRPGQGPRAHQIPLLKLARGKRAVIPSCSWSRDR